jgi:hypothetical protein
MILAYAEMIRQKSGGLTIGASPPVYVHSRITLPPGFISLSAMETILGYDTGLSQSNPFGNIYDVEILTHYSRVRTLVPNQVTPVEAQSSTPSGGNTILTFVYNGSARDRLLRAGVDSFKKHFYLEDIR